MAAMLFVYIKYVTGSVLQGVVEGIHLIGRRMLGSTHVDDILLFIPTRALSYISY